MTDETPEMVERVAMAIYDAESASNFGFLQPAQWESWNQASEANKTYRRSLAIAAIAAMREPTGEMLSALMGDKFLDNTPGGHHRDSATLDWHVMIGAALGNTGNRT